MKIFGMELVRVVEVPKEIVKEQVIVKVPVYQTYSVCNHDTELVYIRAELQKLRRLLEMPIPMPIKLLDSAGVEASFYTPEAFRQRTRPEELSYREHIE